MTCCSLHERTRSMRAARKLLMQVAPQRVRKADDPLDPTTSDGFDAAVARIAGDLGARSAPWDEDLRDAVLGEIAGADWPSLSEEGREALFAGIAARTALTADQLADVAEVFDGATTEIIAATREALRGDGLELATTFNVVDERVQEHLRATEVLFVRDEYGARLTGFEGKARSVVASGLAKGLGQGEIADALATAAEAMFIRRSDWYWTVAAGAFTGRSRSYSQMSGYAEAGVEQYKIAAVLDVRTSNICRYLHGKVFSVGAALDRFAAAEQLAEDDPDGFVDAFKATAPWVRERRDADGELGLWARTRAGDVRVATVVDSAVGLRDAVGTFRDGLDATQLAALGVGFPPYHGLCRTTTVIV